MKHKVIKMGIIIAICGYVYMLLSAILINFLTMNVNENKSKNTDSYYWNVLKKEYPPQEYYVKVNQQKFKYYYFNHNAPKTIILNHGLSVSKNEMVLLGEQLYRFGFNVILYDLRNHGENKSIAASSSYSYYEADDLLKIIKDIKQKHPKTNISLQGISLGATTIIQYIKKYDYLNYVTSYFIESTFRSLYEEVKIQIEKYKIYFLDFMYPGINVTLQLLYNFNLNDVDVSNYLKNVKHPVLLFSPTLDPLINPQNSQILQKNAHNKNVHLKMLEGNTHGRFIYAKNKNQYYNLIKNFFNNKY